MKKVIVSLLLGFSLVSQAEPIIKSIEVESPKPIVVRDGEGGGGVVIDM